MGFEGYVETFMQSALISASLFHPLPPLGIAFSQIRPLSPEFAKEPGLPLGPNIVIYSKIL